MKVSKLVADIVKKSEEKFGVDDHRNDCISVGMSINSGVWFVWLERPTQDQLDRGEVDRINSIKRYDTLVALTCQSSTLIDALVKLQHHVNTVDKNPF